MTPRSLAPSAHYTEDRGKAYLASRQSDPQSLGFELNFNYFKPHLRRGDVVLDFGCGNGGMLPHLRGQVAVAEGLEVNAAAAEVARRGGSVVYGSLEEVPATQRYDVVVSNHVLEHVRDVAGTLAELRRFIRPGGLLVTKLPLDDWREGRQRRWDSHDIDRHLQTWTPRLFANVLLESGYEVRDVRVICSAWHPRLFPLAKLGLGALAFWALAVVKRRRQLLAVAARPSSSVEPITMSERSKPLP